jgi:hypothetical protein
VSGALVSIGAVAAAAGLAVLAREAFPVQGEQLLLPSIGVGLVLLGALCLRLDLFAPVRRDRPGDDAGRTFGPVPML